MELQYDEWMKEVITDGLKEMIEGESPVYEVPGKILFEEREYTPQGILSEVQKRTEVGERILQEIYKKREKIETGIEGFLKHPEDSFCDVEVRKAPTNREIYEKITGEIKNQTPSGKMFLSPYFEACAGELFNFPQRKDYID